MSLVQRVNGMQFIGQHLKIKLTLNYDHEVVWIMLSWLLAYSFRELWKKLLVICCILLIFLLLLIPFPSLNEDLYKERKTNCNIKCLNVSSEDVNLYVSVNLINWTKTNWVGVGFFFWFANFLYFYWELFVCYLAIPLAHHPIYILFDSHYRWRLFLNWFLL